MCVCVLCLSTSAQFVRAHRCEACVLGVERVVVQRIFCPRGSSPIHANGAPVEQTPSLSSSGRPADDSAASDAAVRAKDLGNAKYKQGAYREALAEYQRSLGLLDPGDVIRKAPLLGNIAAAHLMLRRVGECIAACEQSLALDPSNHKIRQRLATAHIAKGDFAAARVVLDFAGADEAVSRLLRHVWEGRRRSVVGAYQEMLAQCAFCRSRNMPSRLAPSTN